jgi:hypothetical protein
LENTILTSLIRNFLSKAHGRTNAAWETVGLDFFIVLWSRGEAIYKTVTANLGGPSVRHMRRLVGAGAKLNGNIIDDSRAALFARIAVIRQQNDGIKLKVSASSDATKV